MPEDQGPGDEEPNEMPSKETIARLDYRGGGVMGKRRPKKAVDLSNLKQLRRQQLDRRAQSEVATDEMRAEIRRLRDKGVTLEAIAAELDVSRQAVWAWGFTTTTKPQA